MKTKFFRKIVETHGRASLIVQTWRATSLLLLATAPAFAQPTEHNINTDGPITITVNDTYTITGTGTSTTNTITVNTGVTAHITLNDVHIDVSSAASVCAFAIASGATVYLTLTGDNTLKSGANRAGLNVPSGATLEITAASTGSLTATGGTATTNKWQRTTGIGADHIGSAHHGGIITIHGGNVTAKGNSSAAGIGGGDYGSNGVTTITGGTVTATGGAYGAGIGGGYRGTGGVITITGGNVTAKGGDRGAGIGGGGDYTNNNAHITDSGGTVTITGGNVTAITGGNRAAGIGGGGLESGSDSTVGTVVITGGNVTASSVGPQPTNGNGTNVYLDTLTVGSPAMANTAVTTGYIDGVPCAKTPDASKGVYGIKDVVSDAAGKVYFYLPATPEAKRVILAHMVDLTVCADKDYKLIPEREASGAALSYTWHESANGGDYTEMHGETSASVAVSAKDAGIYSYVRRVITPACPKGVLTNALTVVALAPAAPVITASSATVCSGADLVFTASGNAGSTFTWTIVSDPPATGTASGDGNSTYTLTAPKVGTYQVEASALVTYDIGDGKPKVCTSAPSTATATVNLYEGEITVVSD